MKTGAGWQRELRLVVIWCTAFLCPALAHAQDYIDSYGLRVASPSMDLGAQPLGYPSGVISAVMAHDRILKRALTELQHPLAVHPFRRGANMVPLLGDQRLEAGLLGDMPTILAAASGSVWVVGLVKQTSTAIVTTGDAQVGGLVGKRIAYVENSSAHHTLLQGLASAGLDESKVKMVPLQVDLMPDALQRGEIDAFAAWEPAPSIALAMGTKNRIVFRGLSSDYFVIQRAFAERSPEAALQVVASFLRAIEWMRRSQRNVEAAANWAMADAAALSGKPGVLSVGQIVAITRREILEVPSAPAIAINPGAHPLKNEFSFLTKLGKLPPGARWENLQSAFAYGGLARVMAEPRQFRTASFDYGD